MKKFLLFCILLVTNPVYASYFPAMQITDGGLTLKTPATSITYKTIMLINKQDYNHALAEANSVVYAYPNDPQAYFLRSQINFALNNIPAAMDDINKSIELKNDGKLYAWRAYLYMKKNDEKFIKNIIDDIDNVLHSDSIKAYLAHFVCGKYNRLFWAVLEDDSILSDIKIMSYKYVISSLNDTYGNIYSVPLIASYIQYIFSLDDNNNFFKKSNKKKVQILESFIDAFEKQQGIYSELIKGILTLASGEIATGSDIINNSFINIDYKDEVEYGLNMLDNSRRILKPKLRVTNYYGLGMRINNHCIAEIRNKELTTKYGIKVGDEVIEIDGISVKYLGENDIIEKLRGEKDSTVKIKFQRCGVLSCSNYTKTIQRTYPITVREKELYNLPAKIKLKNGFYDYYRTSDWSFKLGAKRGE